MKQYGMILKKKKYGFIYMITLSVKTSPLFSAIQFIYMVFGGLFPMFTVFVTAAFLDAAAAVYNNTADMSAVVKPAILYGLMMLYQSVINTFMDLVNCRANIHYRKKLMPLIYDNYTGEILIDGRNLRDLSQSEIKGVASVVYQDFAKYYISLYENIAISDLGNDKNNTDEVKKALLLAGLDDAVEKLPLGIDTPLGKIYEGGVDLSGGQ